MGTQQQQQQQAQQQMLPQGSLMPATGEVLARSSSASTPGTTRFTRSKWSILAWWVLALALVLALVLVLQLWCASAHACMCVCRPIQPGCWTSCWLLPLKGPC